jgi:hypothetical protein
MCWDHWANAVSSDRTAHRRLKGADSVAEIVALICLEARKTFCEALLDIISFFYYTPLKCL